MEPAHPSHPSFFSLARWRQRGRRIGVGLLVLLVALMWLWGVLALCFANTHAGGWRILCPTLFALASLAVLAWIRPRRRGLAVFGLFFAGVVVWFCSLQPANDRDWAPESARLARVTIAGDQATVRNVRHFDYRTPTDFTPRWEDRRYDLSRLRSMDLMLSYWGSKALAHAMVSFGFDDGQYLAVSVEIRKEKSEAYSPTQGVFRQYEKICIFADERDVVRLRTEFRHEDVYLYRTTATPAQVRRIFMRYAADANALADKPEFYNSLTGNCATAVVTRVKEAGIPARMTWETLFPGYAAGYMYDHGNVDTRLPFEELRARSRINAAAHAAGGGGDFSRRIREGLPDPTAAAAKPGT